MKRRDFLKALIAIPFLGLVGKETKTTDLPKMRYKGRIVQEAGYFYAPHIPIMINREVT